MRVLVLFPSSIRMKHLEPPSRGREPPLSLEKKKHKPRTLLRSVVGETAVNFFFVGTPLQLSSHFYP